MTTLNPYMAELLARERQLERLNEAEVHQLLKDRNSSLPEAYRWLEKHVLTRITILKYRSQERSTLAVSHDGRSLLPSRGYNISARPIIKKEINHA